MHDISVVILNHKMRALVEECLKGLYVDIASSGLAVYVVVVDNDSDDGLLEWINEVYPQTLTIQMGGNVGFARGVNRGLQALEAKYFFVLNPDTRFVEPHTLRRLYDWMEAEKTVGMCAPRLVNGDDTLQYSYHRFPSLVVQLLRRSGTLSRMHFFKKRIDRFLLNDVDRSVMRPIDWAQGSALFVRARAIRDAGYFDERFWMYFEDCDWCRRFWRAGWPIYFVPHVTIMHYHGRGSAKLPGLVKPIFKNRLARAHLKSWAQYFWKWRHEPMKIL